MDLPEPEPSRVGRRPGVPGRSAYTALWLFLGFGALYG